MTAARVTPRVVSLRAGALRVALSLVALLLPLAAGAQSAGNVYRIGYLSPGSPPPSPGHVAFMQALSELRWVEGQNLAVERRFAEGRPERLRELAAELVRLKVDLFVAAGNLAVNAAKQATATIPIVMVAAADPVGTGLVKSLARPGGNVTGLSWDVAPEEVGKRLELLKQVVPRASRVAVFDWPLPPGEGIFVEARERAARALGLQLTRHEARKPEEFEGAFAAMARAGEQAVHVVDRGTFRPEAKLIAELAARHRLPAVYNHRLYVAAGGLMSYGKDDREEPRRLATYVDKILRGAKPADLPVEQPMRFELVVNLRAATALGLTLPPSILARVDELIQ